MSGGRTSAYMAYYLLNKYKDREIVVVFANTGKEREETLEFIKNCDLHFKLNTVWIESVQHHGERKSAGFKIVTFETASRNGEPFEDSIKKHGIPNPSFPHCSRELKQAPIKNYIESLGFDNYEIALGIRIDEPKRLKPKDNIIYPFASEFKNTKLMVNQWWSKQAFDLQLKEYEGNCDMCWKKSKRKLLTIILEHPELLTWWNEMEIKYGSFVPETQKSRRSLPITFFRNKETATELLEDSTFPFKKATDLFTLNDLMFSQPELDFTNGCEESCEAF